MKRILTGMGVVFGCLVLSASSCMAASTPESARPMLDKLLQAVSSNDYASVISDGTVAFKTGITKQMIERVSAQLAPRMVKGYEVTFLGELKQQGCQVSLWKVSYKDGGDDTLAKLVIKDGKVAGFLLQ